MEDASENKKETSEDSSEDVKDEPVEKQPEEKQDTEKTDEQIKDEIEEPIEEETVKETEPEEKADETPDEIADEQKPEETPEKPEEAEVKKEKPKRKDRGPDFKYIVRLANTDLDGEKSVIYGLTGIKGVGVQMATLITDEAGINRYMKIGDLKDAQIEKLQETINNVNKNAPGWMLNHRKDYDTGEDLHLISSDIDMRLRDEINIMKKIRSYRGIRHERGLTVRGQRTRANSRKGLALGVSKKREESK